ncbi:MAG: FtsW/RodA/SpoVE family cell cycle protein [Clostridiales bacterium]|nr:FtsW/RodA/SpoVE family cell cycle protein [Clostridiales bacterium]
MKNKVQPAFRQLTVMFLMTVFQLICMADVLNLKKGDEIIIIYTFLAFIALEWLYMMFGTIIAKNDYFELETIGFFLSGIGLTVCASFSKEFAEKQAVSIVLGLITYIFILFVSKDAKIAGALRYPAAVFSLIILTANLMLAKATNGALNWIKIGSFSIQPSEIVKITFIFVGAVSLDKLLSSASLTKYIIFSITCIGCLFVMKDFGTALIFFFTFILIAFMRSGDIRTIILICTVALMGAALIIYFKPYVAKRFSAFRHVWEMSDTLGYQQTRVMIYSASGGLFGLGIGNGRLRNIFAASTDLVFGLICEELGLIVDIAVLLSFVFIAVFAVRNAKNSCSTFHAIASVASAGLLLFQLSLNVFGVTDLLPLTGVTMPFVSRGGSSMICSWGLIAFIKAAGQPFVPPKPDISMSKKRTSKKVIK